MQPAWRWQFLACLVVAAALIQGAAAVARQPVLLRGAPDDGVRLGRLLQQNSDKLSVKFRNGTHEDFLPPGYPLETHKVYTEDGWVLRLYRIPHGGQRNTKPGPRPVVLLWHGFSLSSLSFALWRQNESLAYILADAGFDVWMGNNRGNDYSRGNLHYNYRDIEYWYFSIDELALIDVPASINYILEKTGASKLGMLTHSQGGALAYAMMADLPEMQQKVSVLVAMGPPVFMEYMRAPVLRNWALKDAENMLVLASAGEILRSRSTSRYGFQCRNFEYGEFCTTQTVHMFYGPSAIVPPDDWVVIGHTWPATVSTRNIRHWVQMVKDGKLRFQHFDFGTDCSNRTRFYETCNQEKYGTMEPPEYDLTKVKTPVFIMQGEIDIMVAEEDVLEQVRRLPNAGLIIYQGYSHQDFVWDRNAKHAVDVVELLFRYSPGRCCK